MRFLFRGVLLFCFMGSYSQAALPPDIEREIKRYIQKSPSVSGLRVEPEFLDPSITLPPCIGGSVEIGVAMGSRLWGRTTLQLRCAKAAWMINVPVNIHVFGDYVVASRYLQFGQKVESGDIRVVEGDLSLLADDVIRSPRAAYDRILSRPLQMGAPIGLNDLKESTVIKVGDPVRLLLGGKDFEVSGEGTAQTAGMLGDMVRVRIADGQLLQGKVIRPGVVRINVE
jgi:flagella basal body P-ring formation protein FlgA